MSFLDALISHLLDHAPKSPGDNVTDQTLRLLFQTCPSIVTMAIVKFYNKSDTFWNSQMAFLIINMHGYSDTV